VIHPVAFLMRTESKKYVLPTGQGEEIPVKGGEGGCLL